MKKNLLLFLNMIPFMLFSQKKDTMAPVESKKIFQLGEVTIIQSPKGKMSGRISSRDMNNFNKIDVSSSLNLLTGVSLTASGPRNESMVSVRGFDLRAVPVYMDGVPVYVPYDGYVDLARFTTFDIAAIDLSKGFSSLLYGPNSLGGAINLISKKPSHIFEIDGALGIINKNGYKANLNVGSNFGKFYLQGGFSYLHRNSFRMSNDFIPHRYEDGGERKNSYRTDMKVNMKIGWTPNKNQEYVLGYINQQGEKGNPVYAGDDTLNSLYKKARFWQWPAWNKETYYLQTNTKIQQKHYLKSRFYYDAFKNKINSYDDSTYTTQKKPYAFQSRYNDFTYGGILEYGTVAIAKNELKFSAQTKVDVHRENNLNEPIRHFKDATIYFAAEEVYSIYKKNHKTLNIIPGIGYSARKNLVAEDYESKTQTISNFAKAGVSNALNAQVGIFYSWKNDNTLVTTFSRKTRFATIKDRYSYRMGTAIPNPVLKPENSNNVDISYTSKFFNKFSFQSSLFYSHLTDAIISVSNVQPGKSQMKNTGAAQFMGLELYANYEILKQLTLGANYTYIDRKNLSDPRILFTDVPHSKLFSFIQINPIKEIQLMLSGEYNSYRYSTSYGTKSPQFFLLNTIVSAHPSKYIGIDVGVNNILDKNYTLVEGYPEEGRSFFITLRFSNNKF